MRVTLHRRGKFEGPRIAGFGLMMVGALALVLSVAGAAGAGSGTQAASPAHHTCGTVNTEDGPMAQVLQSIAYGDCGWNNDTTTTVKPNCDCQQTTTTTTKCTTTTTTPVPSTLVAGTTVVVTTTEATTTTPTTMATTTTPTTEASTTEAPTTVTNHVLPPGGGTTTSLKVEGITAGPVGPQSSAVEPTSAVLPFTGSNTMPLAIAGLVMLGAGFGLTRTRTKRRLAR